MQTKLPVNECSMELSFIKASSYGSQETLERAVGCLVVLSDTAQREL